MKNNYLVYKITGGLTHMYYALNNAIHLSIVSGRYLIIDTYSGSFHNDFNKYFTINKFDRYSTNYDVLRQDKTLDPNLYEPYIKENVKWNRCFDMKLSDKLVNRQFNDIFSSKERIVYYAWTEPFDETDRPYYIRVRNDIVEKLKKFEINKEYIGIHFRNTDINNDVNEFISKINELKNQCQIIYFSTDDYSAYDKFANALSKDFEIIRHTKPFNGNGRNIHFSNPNKDELIMNAFIDLYLLMKAKYFIPSMNSGFTWKILELRKKDTFFTQ